MYAEHVPVIAAGMRASLATFKRGAMFAVLSARQPFLTVPDQLDEWQHEGRDARCLFSWKYAAHDYLTEHGATLHRSLAGANNPEGALWSITRVPGLGLVKGAFVLQCMGFDVACLDSRNIRTDGRNPRAYRSDGEDRKAQPAFRRKIARYLADTGGRAEYYWDTWCNEYGAQIGETGDYISALHLAIVPERQKKVLARRALPMVQGSIPF